MLFEDSFSQRCDFQNQISKMSVYCSNYYGSIQCRNFATRFGDRCGFCKVHERGRPIKEGKLPNVPTAWEPCSPTIEEEEDEGYKTTSGSTLCASTGSSTSETRSRQNST
ncbi:hypothetical protein BN1723_013396 [Verticillium longisporum]|uniref:Uncharacterized protein n=1 Tax=Verticillium longisporum TaxID=100787 RepID=A0A0G4LS14_VERLO|nr:hypothetical protein BN1723_013396 [Verticillium longisporum]